MDGGDESHMGASSYNVRSAGALSLGDVSAHLPQTQLPRKYRLPRPGEKSTFQGAGVVPVCRLPDGEVRVLLWQPQKGNKKGVRWYDFGGKKINKAEYTSHCATRKFAKQTYGIFGCNLDFDGIPQSQVGSHLAELYHGSHCNLPLMLKSSADWAQLQLLDDGARIFYNDIHEYHTYLINVPYVASEVLDQISAMVDNGKRAFKWMSVQDLAAQGEIVLAARLHNRNFAGWLRSFADDAWVRKGEAYGDGHLQEATGNFSARRA